MNLYYLSDQKSLRVYKFKKYMQNMFEPKYHRKNTTANQCC